MARFDIGGETLDTDAPQEPGRNRMRRRRVRRAAWFAGGGAVLALAAAFGAMRGSLSPGQAIAIGVPATVLLASGVVVVAMPDPQTARRRGVGTGFVVGSLLARCLPAEEHDDTPQNDDTTQPNNRPLA